MASLTTGGLAMWGAEETSSGNGAATSASSTKNQNWGIGGASGPSKGATSTVVIGPRETWPAPVPSQLDIEERYRRCLSVGQECIQPEELRTLLESKTSPICYDGFEPSGRMHIAQGILKAINVNKLTSSGCVFVFWVADWFALLNNKLGGDLAKIRRTGEYFIEVWKAAGMDMRNVRFMWASDEINRASDAYWLRVMDIARKFNITRIKRCGQIMGRSEGDDQPSAQIFYPCMQCSDIFHIGADICQLGMDQRKINVLAREYCDEIGMKSRKPVVLSHAMLPGLKEGQEKMSKSDPDSAIFMEDSPTEVNSKIKKAYCPPQVVEGNPCIAYMTHVIFPRFAGALEESKNSSKSEGGERSSRNIIIDRSEKNGGNLVYSTAEELIRDYSDGTLHPGDLKPALAKYINLALEPVRTHFEMDANARQLLTAVKQYRVTK